MQILDTYDNVTIGDTVSLKAGGPKMTVIGFAPPEPLPQPTGITNASLTDVQADVRVLYFLETGSPVTLSVPLAALDLPVKDKPVT